MAGKKKRDESLSIAIATQGGLLAALAVLLDGMVHGARAWILLTKAGIAFLLSSALLKLLAAGVMQGVSMKAARSEKKQYDEDLDDPAAVAQGLAAASLETTEKVAS